MIKVPPFKTNLILKEVRKGGDELEGDLPKVPKFDSLDRGADPLDVWLVPSKLQILKLGGLGEVEWM